jgi:Helix-turn-helix domain
MQIPQHAGAQLTERTVHSPHELGEYGAAALCGCSVATLRAWRHDRAHIPFHKRGRRIFYKTADVLAFVDSGRVEVKRP